MSLDSGFLPARRKFWANLSHLQFKFKEFKQYLNLYVLERTRQAYLSYKISTTVLNPKLSVAVLVFFVADFTEYHCV